MKLPIFTGMGEFLGGVETYIPAHVEGDVFILEIFRYEPAPITPDTPLDIEPEVRLRPTDTVRLHCRIATVARPIRLLVLLAVDHEAQKIRNHFAKGGTLP